MTSSISIPMTSTSHTHTTLLKPNQNPFLFGQSLLPKPLSFAKRRVSVTPIRASPSSAKESVLKDFHERRALKVLSNSLSLSHFLFSVYFLQRLFGFRENLRFSNGAEICTFIFNFHERRSTKVLSNCLSLTHFLFCVYFLFNFFQDCLVSLKIKTKRWSQRVLLGSFFLPKTYLFILNIHERIGFKVVFKCLSLTHFLFSVYLLTCLSRLFGF